MNSPMANSKTTNGGIRVTYGVIAVIVTLLVYIGSAIWVFSDMEARLETLERDVFKLQEHAVGPPHRDAATELRILHYRLLQLEKDKQSDTVP